MIAGSLALIGCCAIAACGSSNNTSDQNTGGLTSTVTVTQTVTTPPPTNTATQATTTATNTTATTTTTTTGTGTGTTTAPDATAACVAADLTPSFLGTNGAAGTIAVGFALKNTSSAPCHTYGWPGVQLVSSTGAALTTNYTRTSSDILGSTPADDITLAPGQEASFRFVASGFGASDCANATTMAIIAPDDTTQMSVTMSGGLPACGKATLSPLMKGTSAWPKE
ncbi:MAG TPA: DUF4232 domain-containing protein [Solirubrobacteraceae bacterium]|nr:DUF4232 domain-containing protein [Solirubrobacteraceae bacterium]